MTAIPVCGALLIDSAALLIAVGLVVEAFSSPQINQEPLWCALVMGLCLHWHRDFPAVVSSSFILMLEYENWSSAFVLINGGACLALFGFLCKNGYLTYSKIRGDYPE